MLGMEEEAQEAYREAVQQAAGVAPGSFAKALASLKAFDADILATMEEAVRYLHMGQGEDSWWGLLLALPLVQIEHLLSLVGQCDPMTFAAGSVTSICPPSQILCPHS